MIRSKIASVPIEVVLPMDGETGHCGRITRACVERHDGNVNGVEGDERVNG